MSSIYLPNPCLLGILFTVSTHDGHQLVFHYPSSTNNYGFKATPLPQQFMEFFNADGSESESDDEDDDDGLSINNSDLELYTDDEDGRSSYTMGGSGSSRSNSFKIGMSGHDPASSSKNGGSSSFGNTVNYGNSSNTLTGKDYLDMQERIERKKRKKEEDRRNLMKRLLIQDTNNSNTNSNNSPNTNSNKNINQDSISGDRDGSTINDIINEVTSNNGSASTANTNNNANDKQDGSTSLHNTLGTVNTERDREKLRKIFGFEEEFISEIVTPPKQLCNTRFDLSVDEMTFLGLPIHVQDDGNWKKSNNNYKNNSKNSKNNKNNKNNANSANSKGNTKKNKKNKKTSNINGSGSVANKSEKSFRSASLNNGDDDGDDDDDDGNNDDDDDDEENVADGLYDGQAENGKDSAENEEDCPMTLFHMVFVINPPVVEYNYRIDEMFHFIISRLSMILRHEQNKSNYIWEQVSQILEIKRENTDITVSDLYSLLFEKSELARLIRDTYESVSRSEIANLKINGKLRSFQIPIKKEFSFLPPKEMPFLLGSTLSSVSPFLNLGYGNFDSFGDSDTITQFALILLDDPEIIIKDLNAEKNSPGETLIRIIKPTESLAKLSTLSGLPINEVVTFANHLVYWRRAKAIFPISPKNVYIISPIAPLSNLYRDSAEFSVKFPSLPKLPEFLSIISTSTFKPKSLSSIIPSREHKELYLNAVTSLIKLGYLCQLHTFLLLRITKDIRIKVEEDLEKERKRNSNKDHDHGHHRRQVHEDTTGDTTENGYQTTNASGLLGRHNNPGSSRLAAPGTSSSAISGSSSSIINNDPVGSAAMVTSESTLDTNNSMLGHQLNADRSIFEFDREEDVIVLEPASGSYMELKWINKCLEGKPRHVVAMFNRLQKYMNGRHSLEMFMIKEGVARQDVRELLAVMSEHIITVRHW